MRYLIFFAFVAGVAFAVGCSHVEPPPAAAAPVNASCPIMGHEITDAGGSTSWNGDTIGFCCDGCLPKWNELSEEEKSAKLSEASKANHEPTEHES